MLTSPFFAERAPESTNQKERRRLRRLLEEIHRSHVSDIDSVRAGNAKLLATLAGASVGCADVTVSRCHPRLEIDHILLFPGKSIVLIGPNGSGKSTALDAFQEFRGAELDLGNGKGAVLYAEMGKRAGKVRISRLNQEEILRGMEGVSVQEVLQELEQFYKDQFPVNWEALEAEAFDRNMRNQDAQQEIEERLTKLQHLFQVGEFELRSVEELSGGERTKLSLCMILASEPDILFLDEPTNHLDVESVAKLSELIEGLKRASVSILSVSHVGSYLEEAGGDGVIEIVMDEGTRKTVASSARYSDYVKNRDRQPFSVVCRDVVWQKARPKKSGALIVPANRQITIPCSPLKDIDVPSLLPQEVWVLSGNNGAGKTRLMEAMIQRGKGSVFEQSASIAYLPQFWPAEVAEGTLEAFFYWVQSSINRHAQLTAQHFSSAIANVGFKQEKTEEVKGQELLRRKLASFSGGEQRLLWFVAVSCVENVDVLLLDEPTNHMDPHLQEWVTRAIQSFSGAVVFSTHDLKLLDAIGRGVGNKGSTVQPKNIVLEKRNEVTRLTISGESPAAYMRSLIAGARKQARRVRLK